MLDFSDDNNAYMIYFVSFLGTLAVLPGNIVSALLMDKIGRLRMLGNGTRHFNFRGRGGGVVYQNQKQHYCLNKQGMCFYGIGATNSKQYRYKKISNEKVQFKKVCIDVTQ